MKKSVSTKNTSRNYASAVRAAMNGRFVIRTHYSSVTTGQIAARQTRSPKSFRTVQILETRASRLRSQHA